MHLIQRFLVHFAAAAIVDGFDQRADFPGQ